jgi:hypothetical protein
MKFTLVHRWTERWDGSDETASEFGYGDYTKNHMDDIATIKADTMRLAQSQARKIFKEKGLGKALFSGVGYSAYLKEA